MDQREVVRQRILTLDGLLADPNGPFGTSGGALAKRLADGWNTERRLLGRILAETKGDDVRATLGRWQERTAAFAEKSEADEPSWNDKEGTVWRAEEVLRLLDDFARRLDAWIQSAGGQGAAGASPHASAGAGGGSGSGTAGTTQHAAAGGATAGAGDAPSVPATGARDAIDRETLREIVGDDFDEEDLAVDEASDDDDDRYESVLGSGPGPR